MIVLKPPHGGIPGKDPKKRVRLVGVKPIYGQVDAGRWFWKAFRREATAKGRLKEVRSMKALYFYAEEKDTKIMLGTHVDDLIWGCKPGYEEKLSLIHISEPTRPY